jgi:hypothetical protein
MKRSSTSNGTRTFIDGIEVNPKNGSVQQLSVSEYAGRDALRSLWSISDTAHSGHQCSSATRQSLGEDVAQDVYGSVHAIGGKIGQIRNRAMGVQ